MYLQAKSEVTLGKLSKGLLTAGEIHKAELVIFRYVQRDSLPEVQSQHSKRNLKSLGMYKLNPIVVEGVARVGGRLGNANVSEDVKDVKHPIILPKCHQVTDLIIMHFHQLAGHSGAGFTWASIRREYWIICGATAVPCVIGQCLFCKKCNAPLCKHLMAELPSVRVTPDNPPFYNMGVDDFGPFFVKQGRSHVKHYGCLFTCLAVRAVHIEISHGLYTDSFLNALRRYISRRGVPRSIYSDNGTNFVGAKQELKENLANLNQRSISDHALIQRGIQWYFNPLAASHMGGVWERMVRSAVGFSLRYCLNRL
ncbi:hypothetical protein HOLleu_37488 [Holothuria leucospilota]|uniref:Integrase zinc-binding domain-containing protein n=1 Tax=Holothuria leucospilota TaxID=206669 RepID=A0A9Q0YJH9_HOLLE|nr:hypothetical protein HOLleu_37488 [Holothuria leucospilota]